MKITKEELKSLIKESVNKKIKLDALVSRQNQIQKELSVINEDYDTIAPAQPNAEVSAVSVENEEKESIFDSKPGETVILNFEGVTIKIERQLDDLFKVVDAAESQKIKEGDYIKIQGNDTLEKGKSYKFSIYRQTPLKYETNALESWKIIKN